MSELKTWIGEPPDKCDICSGPLNGVFVDGATRMGPWANMCAGCFRTYGIGIGTGKGQEYNLTGTQWVKVAG